MLVLQLLSLKTNLKNINNGRKKTLQNNTRSIINSYIKVESCYLRHFFVDMKEKPQITELNKQAHCMWVPLLMGHIEAFVHRLRQTL